MGTEKKKYFAFISYNHKDAGWAKWLRRRLEWYRLPAELQIDGHKSKFIREVFRDRDELTGGVLKKELKEKLENSRFLIVVCSPHAARSKWVSDEVAEFIRLGRVDQIIPFIVDGSPQEYGNNDMSVPLMGECFPLALREWNHKCRDKALLGISVNDDGGSSRNKAFIRLVSMMLGLGFDDLWQRHKREMRRLVTLGTMALVVLLSAAYWFMLPVRMSVRLTGEKSSLPEMESGVLTVVGNEYSFHRPDTLIDLGALPGYYRLRDVELTVKTTPYYENVRQTISVSAGLRQEASVLLRRDSTFAVFAGHVYDGRHDDHRSHPVEGATVTVGDKTAETDRMGGFRIEFELEEQSVTKPITVKKAGYTEYQRNDEVPDKGLEYLLF